jgi:hypothetical protein
VSKVSLSIILFHIIVSIVWIHIIVQLYEFKLQR